MQTSVTQNAFADGQQRSMGALIDRLPAAVDKVTLYADRTRRHGQHFTRIVAPTSRTRLGSVSRLAIRKQPRIMYTREGILVIALLE